MSMSTNRLTRIGLGLATVGISLAGVASGAGGASAATQSSNWSGYGVSIFNYGSGKLFTSISGEWVVPKVSQKVKKQAEDSSAWIGIGGNTDLPGQPVGSPTLIQTGTDESVSAAGKASYYAWTEIIPAPESPIASMVVKPGDVMKATITAGSLPVMWKITITDLSRKHDSDVTSTIYPSTMDTAEWINEAPTEIGANAGLATLPKMPAVRFFGATLDGKPMKFAASQQIDMTSGSGAVLQQPSAPGKQSGSFDVCVYPKAKSTCPAPKSRRTKK